MKSINDEMNKLYKNNTVPIQELGEMKSALMAYRGDLMKYMLLSEQREAISKTMGIRKKYY